MRRFFVLSILALIATVTSAQTMLAQADQYDSPWVQQAPNGWVLDISGAGRKEQLVLMQTPKGLHFTSTTICTDGVYSETYTWRHGNKFAFGVSCTGERVVRPTTYWHGWIDPLPHKLRGVRSSTHKSLRTLI